MNINNPNDRIVYRDILNIWEISDDDMITHGILADLTMQIAVINQKRDELYARLGNNYDSILLDYILRERVYALKLSKETIMSYITINKEKR